MQGLAEGSDWHLVGRKRFADGVLESLFVCSAAWQNTRAVVSQSTEGHLHSFWWGDTFHSSSIDFFLFLRCQTQLHWGTDQNRRAEYNRGLKCWRLIDTWCMSQVSVTLDISIAFYIYLSTLRSIHTFKCKCFSITSRITSNYCKKKLDTENRETRFYALLRWILQTCRRRETSQKL